MSFCCRGGRRAPPASGPLLAAPPGHVGCRPPLRPRAGPGGGCGAGRPGPRLPRCASGSPPAPGSSATAPEPGTGNREPGRRHAEPARGAAAGGRGGGEAGAGPEGRARGRERSRRARGRAEGAGRLGEGTPTRAARSPVSGLFARPPRPLPDPSSRFQWLLS